MAGGAVLCVGSTGGLDDALGVMSPQDCAPGWIEPTVSSHPALAATSGPLHVYDGITVAIRGADEVGTLHGRSAVTWRRHGAGHAALIGPDIVSAVAHIQQADSVHEDGEPAPDGTAALDDGILKAEDGLVLDWARDRQDARVPRGLFPGSWGGGVSAPEVGPPDALHSFPIFRDPVADSLRELLLGSLLHLAASTAVPLTMLWYWPRGLPAVGHISHDSDGNDPVVAEKLHQVCLDADVRTTWCMLYPGGYAPAFYRRVRDDGSEVALHYDALEGRGIRAWGKENFSAQAAWLRDMTGHDEILSNKNHYTRWEGRVEFFDWCVDEGIRVDQSKGPSKTGTIGFPFGSCHLWKPLDTDGSEPRFIDAYCLPLMTQDLVITAPAAFAPVLTDAARQRHGVAHFLYHPAHIAKDGVAESFHDLANYARDAGMEWWTSAELAAWEDARRSVTVADGRLTSGAPIEDATVLRLVPDGATSDEGAATVTRYGFRFEQRVGAL